MKRTLLVVGGGLEAVSGILRAREMGIHVVVSDGNPEAPGLGCADDRLVASTYDVGATTSAAAHYHKTVRRLNGVMCIASDIPLTVATVAAQLDLPGIPLDAARRAADKIEMKEKFRADGIPVPWFSPVESSDHLTRLVRERGYPLVLKPVDSRGARGVLRLTTAVDLVWAFGVSRSHSPTHRVMVEQFLDGPQVSTESMVLDGQAYTPGFADRNYEYLDRYAPHIIENGGELPSHLPAHIQQSVHQLVQEAALSMGVKNGVVKGDIVVHEGKPFVIELAARLSGGYFCTHEIPLNTGVEFVTQAIRLALGERPGAADLTPRFQRGVAQRYVFPTPGRVTRITGADTLAGRPGIAYWELRVKPGDVVRPIDSHPARAGVVIAAAEDREAAVRQAVDAIAAINVETVPLER